MAEFRSTAQELMQVFSRPRPPGSAGEQETARAIQQWLEAQGIPYRVHSFPLYPYFFESIGVWIILSRTVLWLAVWARWGWAALVIALVGLFGGSVDILLGRPLVTWPGRRQGKNILVDFTPPGARREIVFCAHYDSKTELLDHRQRRIFVERTRFWAGLTLFVGGLALGTEYLASPAAAEILHWANVGAATMLLLAAWGLGLHLSVGRLVEQSSGAVDNGAACATLLMFAHRLAHEEIPSPDTRVTLALFTGEEANMQGSRAYVRSREWPLPVRVINLELLGQDGPYILWRQDGDAFHRVETSPDLRAWVTKVVTQVTGKPPQEEDLINSDAFPFLRVGIPAVTLGTADTRWGTRGLHRPTDNLARVHVERLAEHVDVLWHLVGHKAWDAIM